MGERKVLNKYFPPDFDPADLPKGQRGKDNAMKVRMMLPMTVRCQTCGEFMYKGTKFNCKKEDVVGETYLGLQIFRFYMRCRKCSAEITYLTDPQHLDYKMEHGATRNFEQWKQEQSIEEALKSRRDAEDEDKVKRLENKTADAKREMDMMGMLDDMLHTKGQHARVSTEDAIAALKARSEAEATAAGQQVDDLTPEDEAALERMVAGGAFTRRVDEDEEATAMLGVGVGVKRLAAAPPRRVARVKVQKVPPSASAPEAAQTASASQRAESEAPLEEHGGPTPRVDARNGAPDAIQQAGLSETSNSAPTRGLGLGGYGGASSSSCGSSGNDNCNG